jgi:hypothetical protein
MVERDAELLCKHNIMDYSLLFAIEKNENYSKFKALGSRGTKSTLSNEEMVEKECKYH